MEHGALTYSREEFQLLGFYIKMQLNSFRRRRLNLEDSKNEIG